MKTALITLGSIALALFVLVLGARWFFGRPFDQARHFLLHDVDYHAVSVACLDLMTQPQYKPLIDQYPSGDDPRLPTAIRDVKAFWLSVNTNEVLIMKTGGFYHMGLVFERSTTASNAYELLFREERRDVPDRLLYTLPVSTNAPIEPR
ncbi:MAG TPA: hypothetical protein VFV96_15610 [Verrucomicrobiae bacterium]|nr:hypothetical protein [Verrucomicrobiae bacterium]